MSLVVVAHPTTTTKTITMGSSNSSIRDPVMVGSTEARPVDLKTITADMEVDNRTNKIIIIITINLAEATINLHRLKSTLINLETYKLFIGEHLTFFQDGVNEEILRRLG